jgi:hypothetical protein
MMMNKPKVKTVKVEHHLSNCTITGIQFDAKAVDAITTIAEGLKQNAIALGKLAEVLSASNINIEAFIRIDTPK